MDYQPGALGHLLQHPEEEQSILVIQKDVLSRVTARGDVVDRAGELDAKGTRHRATLHRRRSRFKT
jgi:hypothetical protein